MEAKRETQKAQMIAEGAEDLGVRTQQRRAVHSWFLLLLRRLSLLRLPILGGISNESSATVLPRDAALDPRATRTKIDNEANT